jgi:hypothetical protein
MAAKRRKPTEKEPNRTVAGAGSRLEALEAIRLVLARQLDESALCRSCQVELGGEAPAAKAALAKELRAVLSEIEALKVPEVPSGLDQLAAAREARLAAAHVAGSAVRRVRQRQRG